MAFKIEDLYCDLESVRQVKAGSRTGTPVRADTVMFAKPVRCTLIVEDAPPNTKITKDLALHALWESMTDLSLEKGLKDSIHQGFINSLERAHRKDKA